MVISISARKLERSTEFLARLFRGGAPRMKFYRVEIGNVLILVKGTVQCIVKYLVNTWMCCLLECDREND